VARAALVRLIGSVVLTLTGIVWVGQGLGFIGGSFMTGDPFWALMGGLALIVGLGLGWTVYRGRGGAG
jgi:hypothetical protein